MHEHPLTATSWREPGVINLAGENGVIKTKAHMCRFGMTQNIEQATRCLKKPIGFLTNSFCVAEELNLTCNESHEHITLEAKPRTMQAPIYLPALCRAICRGMKHQKHLDAMDLMTLGCIQSLSESAIQESVKASEELHHKDEWQSAWDDVIGKRSRLNWSAKLSKRKSNISKRCKCTIKYQSANVSKPQARNRLVCDGSILINKIKEFPNIGPDLWLRRSKEARCQSYMRQPRLWNASEWSYPA